MKFGKQFETEINAAGVLGDRVPWIDYGCVPYVSRVDGQKNTFKCPLRAAEHRRVPRRLSPVPATIADLSLLTKIPENRKLKKLRNCRCHMDCVQKEEENTPLKRADPEEEAAFFSDDGDAATENAVGEKSAAQDNGTPQKDDAPCERCSQLFYAELDKSMKATSKAYFSWVSRILSRAPFEHSKSWWRKALNLDAVNCGPGMSSSKGQKINASLGFTAPRDEEGKDYALDLSGVDIDLEHEAKECIHWIELNSTALRKILKKWDKANHSTKGRQTLRRYWTDSQYQMLFSPLILELRAVAGMMEGGLEGPHWNLHDDEHDDDEHAHANVDHSEGTGVLTCPICFDTLYKPVGLQCGHVFCRDCLLQSAGVLKEGATLADLRMEPAQFHDDRIPLTNGLRRHSEGQDSAHSAEGDQEDGAVRSNEDGAALPPGRKYRARRDRCPQCRTEDVFGSSVRLRHVQDCLRRVDPEGYKARKAESKKLRGKLKSEAVMNNIVNGLIKLVAPTNRGMNLIDPRTGQIRT